MSRVLEVRFGPELAGTLGEIATGLSFRYDASWLRRPDAFALSASLPLDDGSFDDAATRFFGNLLPEGGARAAICRRLGISEDNDFALLEAIGRDCAGALVVAPPDAPAGARGSYRRLTPRKLAELVASGSAAAAVLDEDVRLSLAGAQDKLVLKAERGRLFLPVGGSASTHVLKLPSREYANLVANELLVMRLAGAAGLPVARASLHVERGAPAALLVERYDRVVVNGEIRRLHQEDLCQALGVDRRRKYESEGGPTFAICYSHVRERSHRAIEDTRALLSWLGFCLAVGNRDNHAKNLSIVRREDGGWVLAPFYDLVCTLAYRRLSRRLAFSVGGDFDGGNLSRDSLKREAERLEVRGLYLMETIARMSARVRELVNDTSAEVVEDFGGKAVLDEPVKAIRKATRALDRALGA